MEAVQVCGSNIVLRVKIAQFQPMTIFVTLGKSFSFSLYQIFYYKMGQIFYKVDINIKWDGWPGSVSEANEWRDPIRIW